MRRPCLLFLTLAALVVGCGKTESDPRPVHVNPDPQLKRMRAGSPNQPKNRPVRPEQLPQ
jgi:hypothetical protein